ncbi:MAG: shikimate dehydrogenase [Nitrospirae bacterium]|nr:shikimate dehydrogenase [Nitrospirota bacterium]
MRISGRTRTYGILGYPVSHSLSPVMQNAAFGQMKFDAAYLPFEVRPEDLRAALDGIRALGVAGVNVTIPHKEAVLAYLDDVDPEAAAIGAVNTVVNRDGRLIGYNTDGAGFLAALRSEARFAPKKRNVLILGAGGAARGIAHTVASAGAASLVIANRTVSHADLLAQGLSHHFPYLKVRTCELNPAAMEPHLASAHLVIQTTSLGMKPTDPSPIPSKLFRKDHVVCDIVYTQETPLLKAARSRGVKVSGGLGMLVHQGAAAIFLWTGRRPNLNVMKLALVAGIRAKSARKR